VTGEPELFIEARDGVGRITLNRPRALNALTLGMIRAIDPALRAWADDPAVREVVVTGAGERAFCAGGDVRGLHEKHAQGGADDYAAIFFREEYRLNRLIKRYPKPYVAILDGIAMGGGVGLSVHGSIRVATERTLFAMPEMAIGFFPDVGGGHFLAHCPDHLGLYMALTGARAGPADSVYLGAATHFVPDRRLADFEAAIGEAPVEELLHRFAAAPGPAPLAAIADGIGRCFAAADVESILAALDAEGGDWAGNAASAMRRVSPTALKVAKAQLERARGLDFEANMVMEYRLSQHFMDAPDFREGVRALLVDKDNAPRWRPARLEEVSAAMVEAFFAPLAGRELDFA